MVRLLTISPTFGIPLVAIRRLVIRWIPLGRRCGSRVSRMFLTRSVRMMNLNWVVVVRRNITRLLVVDLGRRRVNRIRLRRFGIVLLSARCRCRMRKTPLDRKRNMGITKRCRIGRVVSRAPLTIAIPARTNRRWWLLSGLGWSRLSGSRLVTNKSIYASSPLGTGGSDSVVEVVGPEMAR